MDGIKRRYRGQLNVVYVDIDRVKGKELAREHGVMGAPTLLFLDSEGKQVNVLRGAESQLMLEQAVEDWLAGGGFVSGWSWQDGFEREQPCVVCCEAGPSCSHLLFGDEAD